MIPKHHTTAYVIANCKSYITNLESKLLLGLVTPASVKRDVYLLFKQANDDRKALPKEFCDLYVKVGGLETTHAVSYNKEEAWRSEPSYKIRFADPADDDVRTGVVKRGKPKYPNRFKEKYRI